MAFQWVHTSATFAITGTYRKLGPDHAGRCWPGLVVQRLS